MKRLLLILVIFGVLLFAQGAYKTVEITAYATGTGRDTSAVFTIYPYMTFWHAVQDTCTTGTDSSAQIWYLQESPDQVEWVTVKTDSIKTDSTWAYDNITTSAVPVAMWGRIINRGCVTNKKLYATKLTSFMVGYEER